jgi:hypothetical protein
MGAMVVCNIAEDAIRVLGIPKALPHPSLGYRDVGCAPLILHQQEAGLCACDGIPEPLFQVAQRFATIRNGINYIGERNQ